MYSSTENERKKTVIRRRAATVCSALYDIFLPHICALCNKERVEENFCADCSALFEQNRLTGSSCPICSEPYISKETTEHLCVHCLQSAPNFLKAKSLYLYKGAVLDALHRLKYNGEIALANPLGKFLCAGIEEMRIDIDAVVPVPIYTKRLKKRGFNQSLLIAKEVSNRLSVQLDFKGLKRIKETEAQVGLSRTERANNIKGAFCVAKPELYRNRTVLIVDDIYTTGATMRECAGVLKAAGACVYAICVARTAKF